MNTNDSRHAVGHEFESPAWGLGRFERLTSTRPVLAAGEAWFDCPLVGRTQWEALGAFNPAAVVRDGRVFLLYRAAGREGFALGVSRLGLAWSDDGLHFERHPLPVLYPEPGPWQALELGTGLQDPRLVETEEGLYVLTYAMFDLENCYMAVATSRDLFHWEKRGLAFSGKYARWWSKAGAIVSRLVDGRMVATRLQGKYWMYWGESDIYLATSDDCIHWTPVEVEVEARKGLRLVAGEWRERWQPGQNVLRPVVMPRRGRFDGALVEPGPPALLTEDGILLIYNGSNGGPGAGDPDLVPGAYSVGQVLFDGHDPAAVLGRTTQPFLKPELDYELRGAINNVCFTNGLVHFQGRWLLYHSGGDQAVGVGAFARPIEPKSR